MNKSLQHLILIGMPGSGKSTIGQMLAQALNLPWQDMDSLIKERINMNIVDYWKHFGEFQFRSLERKIMLELMMDSTSVISTGGGCPVFMDNMFHINKHRSIFLTVNSQNLLFRLGSGNRAVFLGHDHVDIHLITQLYSKRLKYYNRAQVKCSNDGEIQNTLNNLLSHLFI